MRTLVPAETLVYLETNDLAAALQPIVDSKPFTEVAKSKPDFSALKGVQLAVAVTGFETSEEKLTDEHSVGRIQPRFVAIIDTHAWNFQAVAFAENQIGRFVGEMLGDAKMGRNQKSLETGGVWVTWAGGQDGRIAHALIIDGLIYFGNDETAIDKCLAIRRGEADSIAKAGKVQASVPGSLASGYIGPDGIAQIANIVGLKFASEAGEDSEVQSAIAGILPPLLRNSVTEISWTATKTEQGFEDKYQIAMPSDIANVFHETLRASGSAPAASETFIPQNTPAYFIPADSISITRYNPANAQIALRSLWLAVQSKLDPIARRTLAEFPSIVFEPYGIRDGESFLGLVDSDLVTARLRDDEDSVVVIAKSKPESNMGMALSRDINLNKKSTPGHGSDYWISEDDQLAFARYGTYTLSGDKEAVLRCLEPQINRPNLYRTDIVHRFFAVKDAIATTLTNDRTTAILLVDILARESHGDTKAVSTYFTETRFTKTGMERKTVSDFGLIGSIIAQLNAE